VGGDERGNKKENMIDDRVLREHVSWAYLHRTIVTTWHFSTM